MRSLIALVRGGLLLLIVGGSARLGRSRLGDRLGDRLRGSYGGRNGREGRRWLSRSLLCARLDDGCLDSVSTLTAKAQASELHLHSRHRAGSSRQNNTLVIGIPVSTSSRSGSRLSSSSLGSHSVETRWTGISRNGFWSGLDGLRRWSKGLAGDRWVLPCCFLHLRLDWLRLAFRLCLEYLLGLFLDFCGCRRVSPCLFWLCGSLFVDLLGYFFRRFSRGLLCSDRCWSFDLGCRWWECWLGLLNGSRVSACLAPNGLSVLTLQFAPKSTLAWQLGQAS